MIYGHAIVGKCIKWSCVYNNIAKDPLSFTQVSFVVDCDNTMVSTSSRL